MYVLHQSYLCKALDVIKVCHVTVQIKTFHGASDNEVKRIINSWANIGQTTYGFIVLQQALKIGLVYFTSKSPFTLQAVKDLHLVSLEESLFGSLQLENAGCFLDAVKPFKALVAEKMLNSLGSGTPLCVARSPFWDDVSMGAAAWVFIWLASQAPIPVMPGLGLDE